MLRDAITVDMPLGMSLNPMILIIRNSLKTNSGKDAVR